MTNEPSKRPRSPLKNFAIFSGMAIQMGLTIFLFAYAGRWLDDTYNQGKKLYLIILTLLGVALAIFVVLRQLKKNEDS